MLISYQWTDVTFRNGWFNQIATGGSVRCPRRDDSHIIHLSDILVSIYDFAQSTTTIIALTIFKVSIITRLMTVDSTSSIMMLSIFHNVHYEILR